MSGRTPAIAFPDNAGIFEWLRPGEYQRVERMIAGLTQVGIRRLRTVVSWADYHGPGGRLWYDWLLPRLGASFELLPCVTYTPPSLGLEPRVSSPPRNPRDYADFVDRIITRYGEHFDWVQLWNEPNSLSNWDWALDPNWEVFSEMIGGAAFWTQKRGKKTVLAGICQPDPVWLDLICGNGVLDYVDAVGLHGFPGTWQAHWPGWPQVVGQMERTLAEHGHRPEIWITEAGYSTWRCDEARQIEHFLVTARAPVARWYWHGWQDLDPAVASREGFHFDERHYHLGLVRADGSPKLLCRMLEQGGLEGARAVAALQAPAPAIVGEAQKPVLITGGAGFVGCNLAHRLAASGREVLIYDNLSRAGVEQNLVWLRQKHGERVSAMLGDIRDGHTLREAVACCSEIFHFAAQVAVTTSVADPVTDFEVNLRGSVNLLEAIRAQETPPPLVFASTNKVYGTLDGIRLTERKSRYEPLSTLVRRFGVDESRPLDLHSPYGCSKGGADQYVLDYCRIYGLRACVFRMSCLYGPHQFGTEDQGWVAHFLISARDGQPITIYGDGKQVRDVLFVDDVVEAFRLAQLHMDRVSGHAFNIGGGPANAVSLREMVSMIARLMGRKPALTYGAWRSGDQLYYVSDTRRFQQVTGWQARIPAAAGLIRLNEWLCGGRDEAPAAASG